MMKDNKIVKLTLFLIIVCGVSSLLIAYINDVTLPVITQQKEAAIQSGYSEVFPEATEYVEAEYVGDNNTITSLVLAKKQGQDAGVIYTVAPGGYNGAVETLVAFDITSKKITGIKILAQAETAGLGANCSQPWFAARFADKPAEQELVVVKTEPAADQEIQAITAATITSTAVTDGINVARADFMSNYASN